MRSRNSSDYTATGTVLSHHNCCLCGGKKGVNVEQLQTSDDFGCLVGYRAKVGHLRLDTNNDTGRDADTSS